MLAYEGMAEPSSIDAKSGKDGAQGALEGGLPNLARVTPIVLCMFILVSIIDTVLKYVEDSRRA